MLHCELLFPWKKVVQRKMISSYASTKQSDELDSDIGDKNECILTEWPNGKDKIPIYHKPQGSLV